MDAALRTRRCCRTRIIQKSQRIQGAKQICVAMTRQVYDQICWPPVNLRCRRCYRRLVLKTLIPFPHPVLASVGDHSRGGQFMLHAANHERFWH